MSSEIGSRPFGVIFTVRSAVFICGETDVTVPWRIVPVSFLSVWLAHCFTSRRGKTVEERKEGAGEGTLNTPFFNSIVTVSLAHFIRNLYQLVFPRHIYPVSW